MIAHIIKIASDPSFDPENDDEEVNDDLIEVANDNGGGEIEAFSTVFEDGDLSGLSVRISAY